MRLFYAFRDRMDSVLQTIAVVLFALGILLTLIGVFFRFFSFLPSLTWTEEATRVLIIASIFLVAYIGLRKGTQMTLNMILDILPVTWNRILTIVNQILMIIFLSVITYYGIILAVLSKDQISPVLQISMFYPYLIIPFGSVLMIMESIVKIIETLKNPGKPSRDENEIVFVD